MNKSYVLYNLKEAQEQLNQLVTDLESQPDYGQGEFVADMSHIYHHVNTAWNAREASAASVEACSESDFNRWRTMPSASELLLEG